MCVCIYIYIYGCAGVGLCVCSWMGGQEEDLISSIFEAVLECPEDFPLYILARRPHKELWLRKLARPEEKDEGRQSRVRLQDGQLGVRIRSCQLGVRTAKPTKTHRLGIISLINRFLRKARNIFTYKFNQFASRYFF